MTEDTVRGYLDELHAAGYVEIVRADPAADSAHYEPDDIIILKAGN